MGYHKLRYLTRRGNAFVFRMRLPVQAAHRFGRRELKCTLKTDDINEARLRCRLLTTAFEQLFAKVHTMNELTQENLINIAQDYFRHLLRCENEDLFVMREVHRFDEDEIKDAGEKRSGMISVLQHQPPNAGNRDMRKWLDKHGGKTVNEQSDSFGILTKYFGRARLEAAKIGQAKMIGNIAHTVSLDPLYAGMMDDTYLSLQEAHERHFPNLPLNPMLVINEDHHADATLSAAIKGFITYKKKLKAWTEKTEAENIKSLDWFLEVFGNDRLITTIKASDISEFQDMLFSVPKGATQKLKTKSLKKAIEGRAEGMETLSEPTILKYMTAIRSLLEWACDEGLISKVPGKNVFIKVKKDKSDKMPFDQGQMTTIYQSPIFTGCLSESRRSKEGKFIFKRAYYWAMLILAFTGARIGEVVQLELEDVKEVDGVWLFDVNDEELKKLKTKNSRRKVPIHDFLINIGFLDFYRSRLEMKKTGKLFHELQAADNPEGAFSKIGNRYTHHGWV